ncbi:unnamed protein product, partial [Callosobruchus maculatus]
KRGGGKVINEAGYGARISNFINSWINIIHSEVALSWIQGYKSPVLDSIAKSRPPTASNWSASERHFIDIEIDYFK